MVWFLIGLTLGGLLGAIMMALLQINRDYFDE
jgi:hypothetical protein